MEKLRHNNRIETLEDFTKKAAEAAKTYVIASRSYQTNEELLWEPWEDRQMQFYGEYFAKDYGKQYSDQDGLRLGSPFSGNTKLWYRKNRMFPEGTFIMDSNEINAQSPEFEEYKKFENYVAERFAEKGIVFTKEYND